MSWRECTLGDVVKLQRGHDLPDRVRVDGPVPVVSSAGITGRHNVAKAEPPGVVTGRYGTIGEVYYLDEPYWPLNTALYAVDFKGNLPRYVAYLLEATLKNYQSEKAAVPGVDRNVLHAVAVKAADTATQVRIVETLVAYDDLIRNNRKRIALLEDAARLLYREWFVHLRFPGHEHVAIIDGLPENWSRLPIGELADVYRGKSYSSAELVEADGQPFVNLKCIERNGGFRSSGLKRFRGDHKPQHRVDPGDIVVAVTDMTRDALVVARAARVPRSVGAEAVFSMDLVKLKPKPTINAAWFYGLLRYSSFPLEVREKATGATVLHLLPKHIEAWSGAPVPPPILRDAFGEHLDAVLAQIDTLEVQIDKLAEARDLLLPRLMNGEVIV